MNKIKFGLISASGMAQSHMAAIRDNKNTELIAICDIDEAKARSAADIFHVDKVYTDYQELLSNAGVDAVVIVTPDQTHREIAIAALDAGKHVLCEKPLALTREDCNAMIKAAASHTELKFMVGQICRFTPGFKAAYDLIRAGEIGELFYVESEYAHDYDEIFKHGSEWRKDPKRHGFLGGACHAVDLLRWIAGDPVEVMAYGNRKMLTYLPTEDCVISIMKFPNEVVGKVFCSIGCKRDYTMRSVFYGSKGTIIADNTNPQITVYKSEDSIDSLYKNKNRQTMPVLYPVNLASHNTYGEMTVFAEAIITNGKIPTDAIEGSKTVEVCLSVIESIKTGNPVKLTY
ncbi:oxidoreductase [Spirochaetia bacterium]|nr:oxidoreductase [Spirochaetia bacterium]